MGKLYTVQPENKNLPQITCEIKGKIRLEGLKTTNPIAVGDWVEVDENTGLINHIYERDNYIIRQSPRRYWQRQIIAANVDQALLLLTFSNPRTSLGFVDRFLVIAEMYGIDTVLVFNKQDAYTKKDFAKYEEAKETYENLGYKCLLISAQEGYQLEHLEEAMKGKTSLLAGHSGVGKSTVINHFMPNLGLSTNTVSKFSGKGKHTTTFATMYELEEATFLIDTPGIKELGIVYTEVEEVAGYFRELKPLIQECRFNNCLHRNEPKCAVKKAVEEGEIAMTRYANYLHIMDNIEERDYWERKK